MTLTWSGIANHRGGYTVAYGEHPSGTLSTQTVAFSANRTVTITGLTNDTTYRFRVQARGHSGHTASAWTSFVTATPTAQTVTAPSVPQNVSVTPGDGKLTLTWQAPSSWGTWPAAGYEVFWKESAHPATAWVGVPQGSTLNHGNVASTATSYEFTGRSRDGHTSAIHTVTNGTSYDLRIRAYSQQPMTDGSQDSHFQESSWVTVSNKVPTAQVSTVPTNVCVKTGVYPATGAVVAARGTPFISYHAENPDENAYGGWRFQIKAAADNWPTRTNLPAVPSGSVSDEDTNFDDPCGEGSVVAGLTPGASYHVRFYLVDNTLQPVSDSTNQLRVTMPQATQSTNANLSALTVGSSTSSTGTFTDFSIGTFGATTTTYTASVANDQTHVKLTPTVADTGAMVGVRKGTSGNFATVTSGQASSAIALDVGANEITVRVTAEDTTTTKDYTVTVTRQAQTSSAVPTNVCVKTGVYPATGAVVAARGTPFIAYNASNPDPNVYLRWAFQIKAAADTWPTRDNLSDEPAGSVSDPDTNFDDGCGADNVIAGLTPGASYDVRFYLLDANQQPLPDSTTPVRVTMPRAPIPTVTAVSGTMTVGDGGSWKGFRASSNTGALSDAEFTSAGVDYRILGLRLNNSGGYLYLHLNRALPREGGLVLNVGNSQFRLAEAAFFTGNYEGVLAGWGYSNQGETPPSWSVGDTVPVSFGVSASSTVKLSVSPNPVSEGASASVEACLSAVPQGTVRIPVTLSHGDSANRSEDGDWGVSLSGDTDGRLPVHTAYSIVISGWLQRACGVVNIPTHPDSDSDDETFTVALDTDNLPPGVQAGSPASVAVEIQEPRNWPKVTLRAVRETVAEGSPVELQATLEKPPADDVAIPLRVRWASSESGDHGFLNSITIAAGSTSGSGTIRTYPDDDTDDEYFTVAVIQPDLPEGVAPGRPSTVGIVIVDAANARLRALDLNAGN